MLELSALQLASFEHGAREAFRAELVLRWPAPRQSASRVSAAQWERAIGEAEREGWDQGLRERDVLAAYVGARLVLGARPWIDAVERWLRPGEAAESFRLASFVAAAHHAIAEHQEPRPCHSPIATAD